MGRSGLLLSLVVLLGSCVAGKYNPARKFSAGQLQEDYAIFRASLEEAHPSLYWYTPKDSMDFYFETGRNRLKDSLTEGQFRTVLSYVIAKIRDGHASVRPSKAATEGPGQNAPFPLYIKAWPDTVVVTANINRRDSAVVRGVVLKSIDNRPIPQIVDSLFAYLPADGYNLTHKYQTLSNGSNFRNLYALVYGLRLRTPVTFLDTANQLRTAMLSLYNARADTARGRREQPPKIPRRERKKMEREMMRNFRIDTALNTAFLEVNTFTKGYGLRRFFRRSFRTINKQHLPNLVVDMRGNGGGSVILSNLLTKYIARAPFTIADTLYAIRRSSHYGKYRENRFLNWLFLQFLTRKKADGRYHFTWFESKKFKPKNRYHFNGMTYIITGGNTFSAASLFTKALYKQENVVVVGEETGGGAYGNTAWLIPDVTLPNTKVRFRLPLFRLVIDKNEVKGRGVIPQVPAPPSVEDIRKNRDYKLEKVKALIREKSTQ
ncbi:S41 family peptidase [Flavisolibacter nicotianae]|uniref:S41 family peptidase n=1 Tax=Flavisolibacter nicotianae TaxID=2364882 RepID=UPI0013C50C82|nr:S41 family peptidase [Flavisolibacter nicotianae]